MSHEGHPHPRYSFALLHLHEETRFAQALQNALERGLPKEAPLTWRYPRELVHGSVGRKSRSILEHSHFAVHLVTSAWERNSFVGEELAMSCEIAVARGRAIPRIVFLDRNAAKHFFAWAHRSLSTVVYPQGDGHCDDMEEVAKWLIGLYELWLFNHDVRNSGLLEREVDRWPSTFEGLRHVVDERLREVFDEDEWQRFVGAEKPAREHLNRTLMSRLRVHGVNEQHGSAKAIAGLALLLGPRDREHRHDEDWHLKWLSAVYNPLPAWFRGTSDPEFPKHHTNRLQRLVRDARKEQRSPRVWAAVDVLGRDGDKLVKRLKDTIEHISIDAADDDSPPYPIRELRVRILVRRGAHNLERRALARNESEEEMIRKASVEIQVHEYPADLHPPIHGNAMGSVVRDGGGDVIYDHLYLSIVDAPGVAGDDYYLYLSRIGRPNNPLKSYQSKLFRQFGQWFKHALAESRHCFTLGGGQG